MGRVCLLNSTGTEVITPASKTDVDAITTVLGSPAQAGEVEAVLGEYSGVVSHALTLAAGATAEPLIKAYNSGTTYTAGQVCSSSNIIYVALRETINDTPASSASDWRAVTPRAVLMSAPDTNAADVVWGSSVHQAQVLAAGGTAIKLSVDTTGLLAIYAKGTISDVVNYVIFE